MNELVELLSRVESATGRDRQLDVAIECALPDLRYGEHSHRPSCAYGRVTCNYPNGRSSTYLPRSYTASVDDALSLLDRQLPGARWALEVVDQPKGFMMTISHGSGDTFIQSRGVSCASSIATLIALIKALSAQE